MQFKEFLNAMNNGNLRAEPEIQGLDIKTGLCKAYVISASRNGLKEYVLVGEGNVPGRTIEQQLYFGFGKNKLVPLVDASNPAEVHFYINKSLKIIFTTREEDMKFHSRNPGVRKTIAYEIKELF